MKLVMNLGKSFQGLAADARQAFGDDIDIIVLALRRDEKPNEFPGREEENIHKLEPALLERTGAKDAAARVVFLDDEGFDARRLGTELGTAIVLMNGGTSRGGLTAVRIFDGLRSGQLVNLQRDFTDVLEKK